MRLKWREILETTICIALPVLFAFVALWPATAGDRVAFGAGGSLFAPPWEEARPAGHGMMAESPSALGESTAYPWFSFIREAGNRGQLPLWNPLEGCGTPFLAVWRTRCLSPFSLPFYWLPLGTAMHVAMLLKLVVAGWCAYYAARRFGFRPPLAAAVATAFQLCGHVYLASTSPLSDVAPWLPLLLVCTERLALGNLRSWPLAALVIGLMTLGGSPETLTACLLLALVYLAARLLLGRTEHGSIPGGLIAFAVAGGLGLALAAVQLAPYLEFIREAASTGKPNGAAPLRLEDAVLWFLPLVRGVRETGADAPELARDVLAVRLLHAGLLQVWFLCLWFAVRPFTPLLQRKRVDAMLLVAALLTTAAVAMPWVTGRVSWDIWPAPYHLLVGNTLLLSLAAVAAAEEWLALNAQQCKTALVRLALLIPLVLALSIVTMVFGNSSEGAGAPALWLQVLVWAGLSAGTFLLVALTLLKPSVRTMGFGLAGLIFISQFYAFHGGIPSTEQRLLYPNTNFIQALAGTEARVGGSLGLRQWPLSANMIPQVYCPSGVMLKRQAAFLARLEQTPLLLRRAGSPVLLLTKDDIRGPFADIRPKLAIRRVFSAGAVLFEDLGTKPRAWMSYDWTPVQTFEPEALNPDGPPLVEGAALPTGLPDPGARVEMKEDSPSRVVIEVEHSRPGGLVLADTCYPGWQASVDGAPTGIFPVDGLFRGVQVPEGKHEIVFSYAPMSLRFGMGITLASCVATMLGLVYMLVQHFRLRRVAR